MKSPARNSESAGPRAASRPRSRGSAGQACRVDATVQDAAAAARTSSGHLHRDSRRAARSGRRAAHGRAAPPARARRASVACGSPAPGTGDRRRGTARRCPRRRRPAGMAIPHSCSTPSSLSPRCRPRCGVPLTVDGQRALRHQPPTRKSAAPPSARRRGRRSQAAEQDLGHCAPPSARRTRSPATSARSGRRRCRARAGPSGRSA